MSTYILPTSPSQHMSTPGIHRWIVLAYGVMIQAVTIGIGIYSFGFFVVPWMTEFGVLRGGLMFAATGLSISAAIISPLCGYLIDRYSSRILLVTASVTFALGFVGISLAPTAIVVILLYALMLPIGTILAGTMMASSLVAKNFDEGRGFALGISALGTSLGGLLFPPLITYYLSILDWRTMFLVIAALVFALVVIPALFILKPDAGQTNDRNSPANLRSKLALMRSPSVLKLGIAFLSPSLIFLAVLHNVGALAEDLSISQKNAAWVASAASIVMVIAKVVNGYLSDRVPHSLLYVAIAVFQIAGMTILISGSSFAFLLVGATLVAAGTAGALPVITSFAASRWGPENFGSIMGVVLALAGLSGLGSAFAGVIRDVSGSYTIAFLCLMLMLLPSTWCFLSLQRTEPARTIR